MAKFFSVRNKTPAVILAASLVLSSLAAYAADEDAMGNTGDDASVQMDAAASPWPVQLTDNGRSFLVYQPQVDKWENNRLEARSAVAVRNGADDQAHFGVIFFSARTEADADGRSLVVRDVAVSRADFPAAGASADDYFSVLRTQFPMQSWRVARDRLQADMEIDKLARQSVQQPLKNDPPRIIFSERPAVLVPIDGEPVLRPVGDTGLMRVTNTRALLLQDKATAQYYLFVAGKWMSAQNLTGPWSVAINPPAQLEQAKQFATQQDQVDLLEADAGNGATQDAAMSVFVSTTPAELLQTEGPAQYAPIERTQLLYVVNSPNKLFLDLRTQNHYALISGRWYRTTSLGQGQWSYVPPANLPGDFAMIPSEHPTESVLAAVPGTPQAREAVIANTVPQMATVARGTAKLEVVYDGTPAFQPIETTPLQYAVNSPVPVIRVTEDTFYALDNGVWFVASSPFGPWAVATFVPPVIYSIPRSSPLYYVTNVRVYDATPEVVYVGYTPGYVGSYVSPESVVVYGTGWPYRPWIGSVWYGAPVTWGFGFSVFNSWWYPYPYAWHRAHWYPTHSHYYRPAWGPWHSPAYAHSRPALAAGVPAWRPASRAGDRNVGRLYDRWDRGSVAWRGPQQDQRRAQNGVATPQRRPSAQNGIATGRDAWRGGGDERRNRGGDSRQLRDNVATPTAPTTRPAPPAVQTPWRRRSEANPGAPARVPNSGNRIENRAFSERADGRPPIERQPNNAQQNAPARTMPWREQPPAAGMSQRAPAQAQRALPQSRDFTPPTARSERPAAAGSPAQNIPWRQPSAAGTPERAPTQGQRAVPQSRNFTPPGRIERPAAAGSTGPAMERPGISGWRGAPSAARQQPSPNAGRPANGGQSGGSGGAQWRERH